MVRADDGFDALGGHFGFGDPEDGIEDDLALIGVAPIGVGVTAGKAETAAAVGPAASRKEAEKNIVRAIDAVAERLGNTRTVCRKYYVHPAVLDAYHNGVIAPEAAPPETIPTP